MTTPTTVPKDIVDTTAVTDVNPLRLSDRCDRCAAQAFVRASILSGEGQPVDLYFCGHHFKRYEASLRAIAVDVQDDTGRINVKPSQSSV